MEYLKKYDLDNDGTVSEKDVEAMKDLHEIERLNRKQSTQKKMAWLAMAIMVITTVLLLTPLIPTDRVKALSELLGMFYLSQAGIVGAFMGFYIADKFNKK